MCYWYLGLSVSNYGHRYIRSFLLYYATSLSYRNKRGRRYNLVVHDDDDTNDLSGLGLSNTTNPTLSTKSEEILSIKTSSTKPDSSLEADNKDAKSDAGFCTGSDTGSDSISDTSSAVVSLSCEMLYWYYHLTDIAIACRLVCYWLMLCDK